MSARAATLRQSSSVVQRRGSETILATYGKTDWRVAYRDCTDIAETVAGILYGWNVRHEPLDPSSMPIATIARLEKRYSWRSPGMAKPLEWRRSPPETRMDVVCDIHDVFFDWFLADRPDYLCLHGAATCLGGGLVLFPCVGKAGKSILTAALARAGHQVYCDDVLAIEPRRNRGFAFGLAPRLRKPLPDTLGRELRTFIDERSGFTSGRWLYLKLRRGEIAPFGRTAPIKAIVLLDRKPAGAARLKTIDEGAMLKELLAQNFACSEPPLAIFERLYAITRGARHHLLTYSTAEAAADLIGREFG